MYNTILPEPPTLSDDQRSLMRLAAAAQTGNLVAARALTPLLERLTAHLEDPMQQLRSGPPTDPDPLPDDAPGGDDPETGPYAVTLQSIQIDRAIQLNRQCPNCEGPHFGWQCPEIAARLFRDAKPEPWKDIALGRELCRMKWQNIKGFVALLTSVPTEHLVIYAESYIAFIRDYRPDSDVTINQVLGTWMRLISDYGDDGPAAPAMRMAA